MKYILSASAAVLMFGNALCDVVASPAEAKPVSDEAVVEEAAEAVETVAGNRYNSVYLGLGVAYNHTKNELKADDSKGSNKANRFLGTVVAGAGKVFNDHFYCGVDAMADFGKTKKKKFDDENKTHNKGFGWNAGLRLGYAADNGLLTYVKGGVSYAKLQVKANDGSDSESCNKVAPMIALGLEKVMDNGFSARGEVQYDFKAKKKFADHKLSRKNAFTVRLIVAKHINY